jgi:hypothetical protein
MKKDINQEANRILFQKSAQFRIELILKQVREKLPETKGIIIIAVGDKGSVFHRSCSLERTIYELDVAGQMCLHEVLGVEFPNNSADYDFGGEEADDNG